VWVFVVGMGSEFERKSWRMKAKLDVRLRSISALMEDTVSVRESHSVELPGGRFARSSCTCASMSMLRMNCIVCRKALLSKYC
jgi:hypothetical protein